MRVHGYAPSLAALALLAALTSGARAQNIQTPAYCRVSTPGTELVVERPSSSEDPVDDVNWFARPVPNPDGRYVVGFASHDQNFLYDLTRGRRVAIPDKSDAVATPDGRYVTVPSHYTATKTVNFYDARALLARLDEGRSAVDVKPAFAHADADVEDVYYQSIGLLSSSRDGDAATTVYRMMFSGGNVKPAPGFRIVDYTFSEREGHFAVRATRAMRLCPQITRDLSTPFISKDGRYVVAHDGGAEGTPGTLKIFEITAIDPAAQATTCEQRVDFGFAAGKADFDYDGTRVTFHISKYGYLTPFVNGGLTAPTITDVVVADLTRDASGRITGYKGLARVTTSATEGVGSYFPAFFPDGKLFYVANSTAKNMDGPKRFSLRVVNPEREVRFANLFTDAGALDAAAAIGELWRASCAADLQPYKVGEAPWAFMSLSPGQCAALVEAKFTGDKDRRDRLLDSCKGPLGR
ncbi:MAG TPA: hypothetical protein VL263_12250 [Vicinamibacterales bacterium]|nr:hypothetical protein [Vicinamibacterales bacterium]